MIVLVPRQSFIVCNTILKRRQPLHPKHLVGLIRLARKPPTRKGTRRFRGENHHPQLEKEGWDCRNDIFLALIALQQRQLWYFLRFKKYNYDAFKGSGGEENGIATPYLFVRISMEYQEIELIQKAKISLCRLSEHYRDLTLDMWNPHIVVIISFRRGLCIL